MPLYGAKEIVERNLGAFLTDAPLTDRRCWDGAQARPSGVASPPTFHNGWSWDGSATATLLKRALGAPARDRSGSAAAWPFRKVSRNGPLSRGFDAPSTLWETEPL